MFPYGEFFIAWSVLHMLDQELDFDVICVDKQTDPRIRDWGKEGVYTQKEEPTLPIDLRSVYNFPIVKHHYTMPPGEVPYNHYNYEDRELLDA